MRVLEGVIYLSWNFDEEKKREKICCTSSLKSSTRVEKIYYNGIGKMDERKIPEILVRRKIRRMIEANEKSRTYSKRLYYLKKIYIE